jgi:hypothetical protein
MASALNLGDRDPLAGIGAPGDQDYGTKREGEPLTGETLAALYMDITKKYYGHDQGVSVVDDYIRHEWS